MPIDPAQLQTLQEHDRNKKISDIPKFYALANKDTNTAKQIIQQIELAAEHCTWNEETKAIQLAAALKGPASAWFEGLTKSHDVDRKNYTAIKALFLETYEGMITNTALTLSLKELQQRSHEKVSSFNNRVQVVFNHYYDQHVAAAADPDHFDDALNSAGANRAVFKRATERAAKRMMIRMQMSLYEAGLLEPIRLEVARKKYDNLREMQREAAEAEARLSNDKKVTLNLNMMYEDEASLPIGEEGAAEIELDGETFDTISAIYRSKGKRLPSHYKRAYQNFRQKNPGQASGGGPNIPKDRLREMDCWHCGKKGHITAQCYSKKAGKPKNPQAGPRRAVASGSMDNQENTSGVLSVSALGCPQVNASLNF